MRTSVVKFSSILILTLLVVAGCQKSDDPRAYHLSGSVKIDGKPIKAGKISFLPSRKDGNSGSNGIASIFDGNYDTTNLGGRATVGGPHIVQIEEFPSVELNEFEEVVSRSRPTLKKAHLEDLDIPKDPAVVQDFNISSKRKYPKLTAACEALPFGYH